MKQRKYVPVRLADGINIMEILGKTGKSGKLPVQVTVDITPELKNTLLLFGGMFAGAIVATALIRHALK